MELKENDVYQWLWSEAATKNDFGPYRSYHCYSRIAIFRNGALCDTFWSSGEKTIRPENVELEFLGNLDNYELLKYRDSRDYEPEDILDIRHANSSSHAELAPIYLRKGAQTSARAIRYKLHENIKAAQGEHASAFRMVEFHRRMLEEFESRQ